MESHLQQIISSIMFRILEREPSTTLEEVRQQTISILSRSDIIGISESQLEASIANTSQKYRRCGVINPNWLQSKGLQVHFFFVEARPGWLQHIITEADRASKGVSQYLLYGGFDSLIILHGTAVEAERQKQIIENDFYAESLSFTAKSVPLIYRHRSLLTDNDIDCDSDKLNQLVEDFDHLSLKDYRDQLLKDGVLLGSTWQSTNLRDRLSAFVGLTLRGRHEVAPEEILDDLQKNNIINRTLIHLFETDTGHPYKFFAKLACKDQNELDETTNAINSVKFGKVRVEATTMIVANRFDQIPLYRTAVVSFAGELPSLTDVEVAAREMVEDMGAGAAGRFNELESSLKLGLLSALARIHEQFERISLPPQWEEKLRVASLEFGNGALNGGGSNSGLEGAVTSAAATVEDIAKRALKLLAEREFGLNYSLAQKELKLPTSKFHKLTLGKIKSAFEVIRKLERYEDFWAELNDERLASFSAFTEERNAWVHGSYQDLGRTWRIHHSADTIVRSIDLISWIENALILPLELDKNINASRNMERSNSKIDEAVPKEQRNIGFFISYSSEDSHDARRISEAIRATGQSIFFDEWSIDPSDSIVTKISDALLKHDTLALILSPNSIKSQWVRKELDSALMAQLSGHDIKLLPLLIEDCEVPILLKDIQYIDFTKGFEDGLIELIKYIKQRRVEKE